MSKKSFFRTLSVFVILLSFQIAAFACTDIMVAKGASVDGSVITSQTCDGRYDSRLTVIPAADHAEGEMVPIYEWGVYADRKELVKLGEIPQVPHTNQYFSIAYPFANEHQLIIGETTLGGARETTNSDAAIMTIEALSALALQRTDNARDAVLLMGELAVKYGYRTSCYLGECLTVSDPNEVWIFEVFGVGPLWSPEDGTPGAAWAAQRVPDNHVTCVPNFSRIHEINPEDTENFLVCENYIDTAVELGLYDPDSGEEFYWNWTYGARKGKTNSRLWRAYSLLKPSVEWSWDNMDDYPFSIEPDEKVSVFDVINMFRDVMEGTPYSAEDNENWYYENNNGEKVKSPLATPQAPSNWRNLIGVPYMRNIGVTQCSYYFVSQARSWLPNEIGGVCWFGIDNPQKGVFIPVYVSNTGLPESWVNVNRDVVDRSCSYWAFDLVDKLSNNKYQLLWPKVKEFRDEFHAPIFNGQDSVEAAALALYELNPRLGVEYLTNYTNGLLLEAEKKYYDFSEVLLYSALD